MYIRKINSFRFYPISFTSFLYVFYTFLMSCLSRVISHKPFLANYFSLVILHGLLLNCNNNPNLTARGIDGLIITAQCIILSIDSGKCRGTVSAAYGA